MSDHPPLEAIVRVQAGKIDRLEHIVATLAALCATLLSDEVELPDGDDREEAIGDLHDFIHDHIAETEAIAAIRQISKMMQINPN